MQHKQLIFDLLNAQRIRLNPNGSFTTTFIKGWFSYQYQLPSTESHPYHPAISDMSFWQLRDELNDLNQKLSLPPNLEVTATDTRLGQMDDAEKQRADLTEPIEYAGCDGGFGSGSVALELDNHHRGHQEF